MSSPDSITPPNAREFESSVTGDQHHGYPANSSHGRKKRVRNWTADDRAAHRVFERSRREAFKGRLTVSFPYPLDRRATAWSRTARP